MKNSFISHFQQFSSESVNSLALNFDLLWDTENFDKASLITKHRLIKSMVQ